jgi:hypothetical protein
MGDSGVKPDSQPAIVPAFMPHAKRGTAAATRDGSLFAQSACVFIEVPPIIE